ncbi:unnamed protein product [Phytophthora lilii]|uniref:Unnamed protein product n=1 Tax=Phytophthora lilii TaxID=2077276 RepID=A0A9W6X0F4_9STRA|nr:unnamed protein product [Phytophthora lilii]
MSNVNEPIRFGDVIKLQTKSAFVESATPMNLGFLELPGKTQTQLLVVPPVKDEVKERFVEAEFIMYVIILKHFIKLTTTPLLTFFSCNSAPIRGEKQQANGTPLTYQTPFVLRTSDGKDGSTYSLNNKVPGQREGVSLQVSATKGEMYIQVEKEGCINTAGIHYGDDGLNLHVVDSNRVRKTLNHVLTHVTKPKSDTPGGLIACGAKGTALTFSFQRVVDAEGKPQIETQKYIKNPQARRSSMDALSPAKLDELGRADRIDSSEFSDVDAMSRSSSVAGLGSNPASPRGAPATSTLGAPVDAAAVAARLSATKTTEGPETEATVSTSSASAASSSHESVPPPPANAATEVKPAAAPASPLKHAVADTKASTPATQTAPAGSPVKTAAPAVSPAKPEMAKAEPAKTEPVKAETAKAETAKAETANAETAKAETVKTEAAKADTTKVDAAKVETAKTEPAKTEAAKPTQTQPATKTAATPPAAPATGAAKAAPGEPKTVLADASTFPPTPAINGPAPAPTVVSPKSATSPKTTAKAAATPASTPASPKMMKEEEVAKLKAEAEVESLEPACGAKCSVM